MKEVSRKPSEVSSGDLEGDVWRTSCARLSDVLLAIETNRDSRSCEKSTNHERRGKAEQCDVRFAQLESDKCIKEIRGSSVMLGFIKKEAP